jgi:hypothetical protein
MFQGTRDPPRRTENRTDRLNELGALSGLGVVEGGLNNIVGEPDTIKIVGDLARTTKRGGTRRDRLTSREEGAQAFACSAARR